MLQHSQTLIDIQISLTMQITLHSSVTSMGARREHLASRKHAVEKGATMEYVDWEKRGAEAIVTRNAMQKPNAVHGPTLLAKSVHSMSAGANLASVDPRKNFAVANARAQLRG